MTDYPWRRLLSLLAGYKIPSARFEPDDPESLDLLASKFL